MTPGETGTVDAAPILISGVYRCGTTILAQIVGAHPDVALTYDSVKFMRFCYGRYDPISNPDNLERLVSETHDRISVRWDMEFDVGACLAEIRRRGPSYAAAYDAIMRHALQGGRDDGRRWAEKTAVVWTRIPDFLRMFPRGQVIHVLRDPRDATASYKKITFEPGFTYLDCALNCLHAMRSIREYRSRFGDRRVMWIRLEDLLRDPEAASRRLAEFLGLDWRGEMLDPARFHDKGGHPWKNNSAFEPDMSGIAKVPSRWETHLDCAEIAFVEMVTATEAARFGYHYESRPARKEDRDEFEAFLRDPFLGGRYSHWLATGEGQEGYRTDPIQVEFDALKRNAAVTGQED